MAETTPAHVHMRLTRILTTEDYRDVVNALYKARGRWWWIGLQLGLDKDELDNIRKDNVEDCLGEMVAKLLRKRSLKPSWLSLLDALNHYTISEEGLAADIEKKLKAKEEDTTGATPQDPLPRAHDFPVTTKNPQFLGTRFLGTPWKERVTSEGQETLLDTTGVAFGISPGAVPEEEPVQTMVHPTITGPLQSSAQYQLSNPSYRISPSSQFTPQHSMRPDRSMGDGSQSQYQLTSPSYRISPSSQFTPHRSMMPDSPPSKASQFIAQTTTVSATISISQGGALSRLLTVRDFREVYAQMYPQRVRWHPIGLCLGFPLRVLEHIGDEYRQNDQQFGKMLLEWLRRPNLQPSWQSLIDALNHPTVGGEGAADDIRKYVLSKAAEAGGALNRLLTLSDYREVYDQMYPQRVSWHPIGLRLGFPVRVLERIGNEYRQNEQRLEKMLLEWLRRRNFQPSWQSLIDALNHPTVGGEGAADDIRKYVLSKAAEGARDAPLKTMRGGLDLPSVTLKKPGEVDKEEQKVDPMAATLELIRKGNFALRPVDPANVSPKTDEMPRLLDYQPREPSPINIPRMVMKPPDAYSARLYMDTPVPGGPCSRAVFCIVPYQPVYTAFMDAYMEKMEPGMKTSADYVEQPVEFEDTSTEAAVVLELPRETPGYKIISDQEPLTIYRKQVDRVFLSSTNWLQEGPPKLALNISPEGSSATSSSTSWDLNVLGLEDDLIFTLTFPAHSAYTTDRLLALDDFQAVYEQLYPLRGKWHSIGELLGFSQEDLDNYEDENRKNDQRLRMMILDWLRWRKLRPTWKALIEALRDETVGDEGAAHDLQELVMMGTAGSPNSSFT